MGAVVESIALLLRTYNTQYSSSITIARTLQRVLNDSLGQIYVKEYIMMMTIKAAIFIIASIESGYNPNAIGDNGKAIGILQIHECCYNDAVEYAELKGVGVDCVYTNLLGDYELSIDIALLYLERYVKASKQPVTTELCYRIWNGGPDGWKQKCTDNYVRKAKFAEAKSLWVTRIVYGDNNAITTGN